MYDYRNRTIPMTTGQVKRKVEEFAQAARQVRDIGADGLEITGPALRTMATVLSALEGYL